MAAAHLRCQQFSLRCRLLWLPPRPLGSLPLEVARQYVHQLSSYRQRRSALHALWPHPAEASSAPPQDRERVPSGLPKWLPKWLPDWAKGGNFLLYPSDPREHIWTGIATVAAALSGFLIPWEVAFVPPSELYDPTNPTVLLELLLLLIFLLDMLLSFRTVQIEGDSLVDDPAEISRAYMRSHFLLDVLGVVPWDVLALAACTHLASQVAATAGVALPTWVPALKLLHLARLYRVRSLFQFLEYNLSFSMLPITIVRNMTIVLYVTHWAACGFFWEACHSGFDPGVLVGADASFFASLSTTNQYIYSLYWAVTTLSTADLGDNVPSTMQQTISQATRASLFLLFNIALGSYILGTITLLVVKNVERTGKFRERSASLRQYTQVNNIPKDLKDSMQGHLRLHFETDEASDEQVLSIFPTPIRRRIMRYLYIGHLRRCNLFRSCPLRFLDALLVSARVESFMPGVDILSSGDQVNELLLLLNGSVEFLTPDPAYYASIVHKGGREAEGLEPRDSSSSGGGSGSSSSSGSGFEGEWEEVAAAWEASRKAGLASGYHPIRARSLEGFVSRREAGEGSLLGEVAFFTEVPQLETVRSATVCRVLVVSRATYAALERSFAAASRQVLQNLVEQADQAVSEAFQGELVPSQLETLCNIFENSRIVWESSDLEAAFTRASLSLPALTEEALDLAAWTPKQRQAVAALLRMRTLLRQYIARQDMEARTEFLYAASQGDVAKVQQMLQQGCHPDFKDYDGRTALELACMKGHIEVARILLASGADPNAVDSLGRSALLEACQGGHDELISMLRSHGARLLEKTGPMAGAALLCTCVAEGNLPLLRCLTRAGVPVSSPNYNKQTALHLAAADGNLQAVMLLVEQGGADLFAKDRWGSTPLDEARRVRATPVVEFLERQIVKCDRGSWDGIDGWGI